jgi:predicted nucleotide-binding protein
MLDNAAVAFLILTAEDERADGTHVARQNVVHEAGLFQGRLDLSRAIVMVEDGCEPFSNIDGLGQLRFPAGRISAVFEDVRRVLEREGLTEPK